MEKEVIKFRHQFDGVILGDHEVIKSESPVVSGQALTGSEIFRRVSNGLPVGCALRNFNQVNPYLDKLAVYDSIADFKIRHGMIHPDQIPDVVPGDNKSPENDSSPAGEKPADS